jgi:CubicO group peptidase (beta-lactamase class C family)
MSISRLSRMVPALMTLWVLAAVAPLDARAQSGDRDQLLDLMEQIRADNDLPGFSLAVAIDGEIVFSEGVGYAELDNHTPQNGRTVHNIASVSKVVALVALMQLVEEGRVDLDATIQTYLPYYPEKEWPITVRHILTHTSGTRHYRDGEFGEGRVLAMRHYDDFEEATRLWRDDALLFEPGTHWLYSSHAMNLMHGIVEAVSGYGFEEYMRRFVFEPAGMMATQFDVPSRVVHNRGRGHVRDEVGRLINPPFEDPSYKYAGGGMLSTVEDLVRFGIALNDGSLLAPATIQQMYEPQLDESVMEFSRRGEPRALGHRQALAWYLRTDQAGREFPSHTGTVKGTRTFLANYYEQGLVLAIQANALPFDSALYGTAIAQMFLPPVHEPVRGGGG